VRDYKPIQVPQISSAPDIVRAQDTAVIGVDVFVHSALGAEELGRSLEQLTDGGPLALKTIANRGTKAYPATGAMTDMVDHWSCRFMLEDGGSNIDDSAILQLLQRVGEQHRWVHIEKLHVFDGTQGFTRAQGED
jgi:isocitrate dehydrogenase